MKRSLSITATALAVGLVLTGCAGTNPDQETVSKLALTATKPAPGDKKSVAGAWEWRSGWSVLVKVTGKNNDGPYTYWNAYSYLPDGDSWQRKQDELVEASDGPQDTPHRATCMTLAQTDSEVKTCDALSD